MKRKGLRFADAHKMAPLALNCHYYFETITGVWCQVMWKDMLDALESVFGWSVQGRLTMSSEVTYLHIHID